MKRICFLFLTVFILFCACSRRSGEADKSGAEPSAGTEDKKSYYVIETSGAYYSTRTFSDLGVLQSRTNGAHRGVCYFFDPVSEKEVPLCAKTNCTHQGYSWGNTHPDCDACFSELTSFAAIVEDSLYYIGVDDEDGFLRKKICRADPDGTNRKVLEVMEDVQMLESGVAFYEKGYLMYVYLTDTAQDGTPLEKRRTGICLYDLERNEAEYVIGSENYSAMITSAMVLDHCLYYFYCYYTEDPYRKTSYEDVSDEKYWENHEYLESIARTELWAYDLDTKEKRLVMQESGNVGKASLGFGYAYRAGMQGARLISLKTGESRELDWERVSGKSIKIIEEGVLFEGDGSIDLWEFETGEVKHIGSYDKDLVISLEYVGQDWVYGLKYGEGSGKIFYLPREQFMKGDLEWKYLPQED